MAENELSTLERTLVRREIDVESDKRGIVSRVLEAAILPYAKVNPHTAAVEVTDDGRALTLGEWADMHLPPPRTTPATPTSSTASTSDLDALDVDNFHRWPLKKKVSFIEKHGRATFDAMVHESSRRRNLNR